MIQKIIHDFFCFVSDIGTEIEDKPDNSHSTTDSALDISTGIITDTTTDETKFSEVSPKICT